MKNLLIYINPEEKFNKEHEILARIQVDNSLSLGWKEEDIIVITNFEWEYNGVKSKPIDGNSFCSFRPLSNKTITVAKVLEDGINDTYWVHDFDAYQEGTLDVVLNKDVAFTNYGWSRKWSLGSYFFNKGAKDVFGWIKDTIYDQKVEDERALVYLTSRNINDINNRYEKLNITYNFGMRNIATNYAIADKPLRVIHFHPWARGINVLHKFMYGKNELGFPLMTPRLIEIFKYHGIYDTTM